VQLAEWLVTFRERLQTEGGPRARLAVRTLVEATTTRTAGRHESDRGTKRILVLGMVAGFAAAWLAARYVPGADLPGSDWVWVILGVLIMLAGFTLRVGSIVVLGRFFRRDVTIEAAQTVIRRGPYRYIRHPADAGNLLVALGFGLALANRLSIAALVALPFLGLLPRIRVEEAAAGERARRAVSRLRGGHRPARARPLVTLPGRYTHAATELPRPRRLGP
jgi:protein-S-isoprenylcysteine O-methyltransferase